MMGMMGGAPVVKSGDVIINKLKAAKVMEMGDTSDAQIKNLTSGLSGLLKNPMQSKGGGAKSSSQQAANQLSSTFNPLTKNAINNVLIPAIDDIMAEADRIVGRDLSGTGLLDTVSVIQTLDTLSNAAPQYSQVAVLRPALTDDEMDQISLNIIKIATDVDIHAIADSSGQAMVVALAQPLLNILTANEAAKAIATAKAVYLASVSAAGALATAGSPEWQAIMEKAFSEEDLNSIRAKNVDLITPDPVSEPT